MNDNRTNQFQEELDERTRNALHHFGENENDYLLSRVRLDDVEENSGLTPLPAGFYKSEITDSKFGYNGYAKYLQLTFTVIDGVQTGDSATVRLYLWEDAKEMETPCKAIFKRIRRCCELPTETAGTTRDLIGKKLCIRTTLRTNYQGRVHARVVGYYPLSAAPRIQKAEYTVFEPAHNGRLW